MSKRKPLYTFDASAIGVYAVTPAIDGKSHDGEIAVEINDGESLAIVYMSPEEAFKFANEVVVEAAVAATRQAA